MSEITIVPITDEAGQAFLQRCRADKEHVFIREHDEWVGAFDGTRLIGVGGLDHRPKYEKLGALFVDPDYRGQGIGQRLVEARITNRALTYLAFVTRPSEPIYQKLGFIPSGKRTNVSQVVKLTPDMPYHGRAPG